MLRIFRLYAGVGWGAYNEALVVASSAEEAKTLILAETDDMYAFFTQYPDNITIEDIGSVAEKGIIFATGDDC